MAKKRMFDKAIIESDRFIDLPNSTKALYFMAGMDADDKGFFQPKKLQRTCGFSDDDYKILIAKRFFIAFESGVMVITDWNKNNWLDNRRISETEYVDELNLLKIINNKYELIPTESNAKQMLSQNSIEENSIEENSIEENSIDNKKMSLKTDKTDKMSLETDKISSNDSLAIASPIPTENKKEVFNNFLNIYNEECTNLPKCLKITEKRKVAVNKCLKEKINEEVFREICIKANQSNFLIGENDRNWKADFDFVTRSDKAMQILEGKYENRQKSNNIFYEIGKEEGIF